MERKIGKIFEYNGEWYQCIIGHCNQCCFDEAGTCKFIGNPHCAYRNDKKLVCFKKLKKVGEPYRKRVSDGTLSTFQRYRVYNSVILPKEPYIYCNFIDNTIEIEIKQNKKDMEEKKPTYEELLHYYHSTVGLWAIDRSPQEVSLDWICDNAFQLGIDEKDSNSGNIGKNLREFDLEAAKLGKPVCTRDGRKARIICFDLQSIEKTQIVAAVQVTDKQEVIANYYENGRQFVDGISELDLMMLPKKKEGWVNVYRKEQSRYVKGIFPSREIALNSISEKSREYIDTIKINWSE